MREDGRYPESKQQPYIDMVLNLCKHFSTFGKAQIVGQKFFLRQTMHPASLLFYLLLTLLSPRLIAQENVRVALMPWQLIGWDGEFPVRHRTSLQALHQALAAAWIEDAQTLDREQAALSQPSTQKTRSQSIIVGRSRNNLGFEAYLVPILCPLGEHMVLALQLVDLQSQIILAGQQKLIPRGGWEKEDSPLSLLEAPLTALPRLLQDIEVAAIRRQQTAPSDAMKLGLSLLRGSDSSRPGKLACPNLLLAHSLLDQQRVLANLANLEAMHLRDRWQVPGAPQKATRVLAIDWGRFPKGPEKFTFEARWLESILGSSIDPRLKGEATLRRDPDRFEPSADLVALLNREKEQLRLADLPQISRIYKAWVYLDRGRAYGLDMDDRLLLADGERVIKGHVVGFYGPKAGIVSPRGFPVREGAIVFIRKGQREVKIGDTLNFDPKEYPTPWPPAGKK